MCRFSWSSFGNRMFGLTLSLAVVLGACGGEVEPFEPKQPVPGAPPAPRQPLAQSWQPKAAATALEKAAQGWKDYPLSSRADGKNTCLSCHTGFPYLLARPMLRARFGLAQTALEEGYYRGIVERVELRQKVVAWYHNTPQRTQQSLGTEAVLNAAILSFRDHLTGRESPSAATLRALDNLWERQQTSGQQAGSWEWMDYQFEPWESKRSRYWGAALAALAVGWAPGYASRASVAGEHPHSQKLQERIAMLRSYLRAPFDKGEAPLYDKLVLLWASLGLKDLLSPTEQQRILQQLLSKQRKDGGWSMFDLVTWVSGDAGKSDGVASGLVVFVLSQMKPRPDAPAYAAAQKGLGWLAKNQGPDGRWTGPSMLSGRVGNHSHFMGNAATAYATLALAAGL